jgi:hypothetical protein
LRTRGRAGDARRAARLVLAVWTGFGLGAFSSGQDIIDNPAHPAAQNAGLWAILLAASLYPAQMIIENTAAPLAKDAGRVLKLQEVWRVTDESGDFFFKAPRHLNIAPDGTIFIVDIGQFLKFSPDGKFVKNLYRKGEGPGEIRGDFLYALAGGELYIRDFSTGLLWRADFEGNYLGPVGLPSQDLRGLVGVQEKDMVLYKEAWPPFDQRTGKLMDIRQTIFLVAKDGKSEKALETFSYKLFLGRNYGSSWESSMTAMSDDGRRLYAFFGLNYMIDVLDLDGGKIFRRFSRKYPRVPHREQNWEADFRKKYDMPVKEFESDVKALFPNERGLWVATSTTDRDKGDLYDVFDENGRFVDSFYLGAGRTLLKVQGDVLFFLEKDVEENLFVVKSKIIR